MELNLTKDVKANKGFYKYISHKRKTRENASPLQKKTGDLVTWDNEKAKVLNAFFASVFTSMTSLQGSQLSEARLKG